MCLAELSRRGLLLPSRLAEVAPLVSKAIRFDLLRGQHSVGQHVRDAACYVCWAFARAYSPQVLRPHLSILTHGMLVTALFDREVNCRRSAAAALQENVGRQGHASFHLGLELVALVDYTSLGNRKNAYLKRAKMVGGLDGPVNRRLMDHLEGVDAYCSLDDDDRGGGDSGARDVELRRGFGKVAHWDPDLRRLASEGLAKLAENEIAHDPALCSDSVGWGGPGDVLRRLRSVVKEALSPGITLARRHGALLSASSFLRVLGLSSAGRRQLLEPRLGEGVAVVAELVGLVGGLEKARLYRGRGGELVRQASCEYLAVLARACLAVPRKTLFALLDSLHDNLR